MSHIQLTDLTRLCEQALTHEGMSPAHAKIVAEALAQTAQLTDKAEVIFNIYGRQEAGNLVE